MSELFPIGATVRQRGDRTILTVIERKVGRGGVRYVLRLANGISFGSSGKDLELAAADPPKLSPEVARLYASCSAATAAETGSASRAGPRRRRRG